MAENIPIYYAYTGIYTGIYWGKGGVWGFFKGPGSVFRAWDAVDYFGDKSSEAPVPTGVERKPQVHLLLYIMTNANKYSGHETSLLRRC
jgi:hypothetical protein